MPRVSYGDVVKNRTKRILTDLLEFVNYERDDNESILLDWRFKEEKGERPELIVETTLKDLQKLSQLDEHEKDLTTSQIREALFHHMKEFLGILEDNRTKQRGSYKLLFTLKLWSKNTAVNIKRFEEAWEQKRTEQSQTSIFDLEKVIEEGQGEFITNSTNAALGLAIALGVANPGLGAAALVLSFTGTARRAIDYVVNRSNKKLTLEEVVAIAAPLAYLKSFDDWTQENRVLKEKLSQEQNIDNQVDPSLENLTLNRELATNALRNFHTSELAQRYNKILSSQLVEQEFSKTEADIIVTWVAWKAGHYLKEAVEEYSNLSYSGIISIYKHGNYEEYSKPFKSIELYLVEQIATKPQEKVFNEEFSFADIYVPLKAKLVDANGKVRKDSEPFLVDDWAKKMLFNPEKAKHVMFIQAGPGRGKSVFCRIFADWIRQKMLPLWIPILIRLRDIESFETSFEKTLQGAVKADFARDKGWLTDSKIRFLFFLDGFDELRMEGRARGGIERFIQQVGSFQERCDSSEIGHRFIVTGRQLALQGISYLPDNLERVELLAMDNDLQQQWLDKWDKVVHKDFAIAKKKTEAFKKFVQSDHLPKEVKQDLAREPLLLYLLAAMHRDCKIKVEDLEGASGIRAKIGIYEQSLNWVLTEQRKPVQTEIVPLQKDELSQVLIEAGLCVVQSGGDFAKVKIIEERLEKFEPEIVEKIAKIQNQDKDEVLKNALAAFYLKPAAGDQGGSVEFFHKSFGEFLCAKRMQQSLEEWTAPRRRGRGFNLNKDQLAEEIYDLLGYGALTPEIMEYLWGLLFANQEFRPVELFTRLEDFYECWCDGEFIDADGTTLPQAKMRQLRDSKTQFNQEKDILGQRQVDVYTGLNVMSILLMLHQYGLIEGNDKMNFHICGKRNDDEELEDPYRLFRIIGYSRCLSNFGFRDTVSNFLSHADLRNAYLRNINLTKAHLRRADFSNAILSDSDLSQADLRGTIFRNTNLNYAALILANLSHASFRDADLSHADLRNAYLREADFRNAIVLKTNLFKANLIKADFSGANLREADFREADLEDIRWDNETNWSNVRGLDSAINIPEDLKQKLQLDKVANEET
ncbi:MAG: pentapeptide repeat-containing protein [Cyanobacteria bacterium P01_F01_bin.143]